MGYVYFSSPIPADSKFDLTATGDDASGTQLFDNIDLKVSEVKMNPGQYGTPQAVGIVTNTSEKAIDSGATVLLMCFSNGSPTDTINSSTEGSAGIPPGGTGSFSVDLYDKPACPVYAIGSSGYSTTH